MYLYIRLLFSAELHQCILHELAYTIYAHNNAVVNIAVCAYKHGCIMCACMQPRMCVLHVQLTCVSLCVSACMYICVCACVCVCVKEST